jgi:hypothetical protein
MVKDKSQKTKKNNFPPHNICFSFAHTLKGCVEVKDKNFFFTNKIPLERIKDYRTEIENTFRNWSAKTIQQLEQENSCYPVRKDKINKTRSNISQVFQKADYPQPWIEQNIQDPDIYKFKISKQIRMFGIVERNVIYVLLCDIWHLINRNDNFGIPSNLTCTWCLKSCHKETKKK